MTATRELQKYFPTRARAAVLAVAFGVSLTLASGCTKGGNTASTSDGGVTALSDGAALALASASALPKARPFRHPGLAGLVLNSSHELDLTGDQVTAIEHIQDALSAQDGGQQETLARFQTDVASGIREGKFDSARIHDDYDVLDKARADEGQHEAAALRDLHDVLTPPQRTALVAALRVKEAGFDNAPKPPPDLPDGGMSERGKRTLERMTQELSLNPAQQKQVSVLLAKDERSMSDALPVRREEMKKRLDVFVTSFDAPEFDAAKLDPDATEVKAAHEPLAHEVSFLSQLVAILHPAQRDKLASGPPHGMGLPGGMLNGHPGMPMPPAMRPRPPAPAGSAPPPAP